ncbi:MAG: CsiV family protein [Gammaproteobacteria bacterium]
MNRLLVLLLCVLVVPVAYGQEMRIDVIVFRMAANADSPVWDSARELPPCDAVRLRTGGGAEAAFSQGQAGCRLRTDRSAMPGGLNTTDAAPLAEHVNRLRKGGYVVLAAESWRQGSPSGAPVLLRAGQLVHEHPELEGTIAVSGVERLAAVELSLTLQSIAAERPLFASLRETRRLKPGEWHYFDHSLFGALVRVSLP